jgi:hypothetical protein
MVCRNQHWHVTTQQKSKKKKRLACSFLSMSADDCPANIKKSLINTDRKIKNILWMLHLCLKQYTQYICEKNCQWHMTVEQILKDL